MTKFWIYKFVDHYSKGTVFFLAENFVFVNFLRKIQRKMKWCFFLAPKKKTNLKSNEWMANELFHERKTTENLPEIFWKNKNLRVFFFLRFTEEKKKRSSDLRNLSEKSANYEIYGIMGIIVMWFFEQNLKY